MSTNATLSMKMNLRCKSMQSLHGQYLWKVIKYQGFEED